MTVFRIPATTPDHAPPVYRSAYAQTENPCLDIAPHDPGDLFPGRCDRERGHDGPHCTKRYWHSVGFVETTTWADEATGDAPGGLGAPQTDEVGSGATDEPEGPENRVVERWAV